jgi:hypothetical protein
LQIPINAAHEAAMTMTLPAPTTASERAAALAPILLVLIGMVGAIEGLSGLTELRTLFGDTSKIWPSTLVVIALHPVFGLAALVFALAGRLRHGIIALALLALSQWFRDMPADFDLSYDFSGDAFVNAQAAFKIYLRPLFAAGAIIAAWLNRYLAAATVAVMLPTIVDAAGVAAFAIGVMMYGF